MYNTQSYSRRLLLKPVGKSQQLTHRYKKNKKFTISVQRAVNNYDDEIQLLSPLKNACWTDKQHQKQEIPDPRQSQFTFQKYVLLQKILLILTIFYMLICIIRTQVMQNLSEQTAYTEEKDILIIMNIISFSMIFVILMRAVYLNQLSIDQKVIYCVRYRMGVIADIGRFLQNKQKIMYFLMEVGMILIQPSIFSQNVKCSVFQPFDQVYLKQDLNDILCLMSLFRVYLIARSLICITEYSTPRAIRLCNYNRIQHDYIYTVKCLLQEHPLLTIFTAFLIQELILGYAMKVTEGTVHRQNPHFPPTGFQSYHNCFWCVFITMATVGYGDYFPKTIAGRSVSFFCAISGIIVNSLLIVSLSAYLTMQPSQASSHLTLIRLQHQQKLKKEATQALIQTMKLQQYLSSQQVINQNNCRMNKIFISLKHKIDIVKYRSRQIKSLVNNNNIIEEMNRLFQILKQNLIQLYKNQLILKEDLLQYNKRNHKKKIGRSKMQTLLLAQDLVKF